MTREDTLNTRKLQLFLALSRTPHLVIDLATPMAAALLCLGKFPAASTIVVGMITVFAGYACIYALNDVTDYHLDRRRMAAIARGDSCFDLDCIFVRHPLAQGLIPYVKGVAWTIFWGAMALLGAAYLNPLCAAIFVMAGILEVIYCKLYSLSQWKILLAAVVKTLGGLAAIYAVNPEPPGSFVLIFFLWVALWEIGGQNIPNDLVDMQEDSRLGGKTIPVVYGTSSAVMIILTALLASVILGLGIILFSPLPQKWLYGAGALLSGVFLLLLPFHKFVNSRDLKQAVNLFNKASLYPVGILCTTVLCLVL
ncbi:MAG: UbiA family prenyltransferase [Deltaproteobacteria bacterium]|nr:UbiA family prenyltransferase [Deltaproteobacteria bacterium]MBW2072219.1 UbiA family prenyltransferase [Deltaproteobacteria bacterium]